MYLCVAGQLGHQRRVSTRLEKGLRPRVGHGDRSSLRRVFVPPAVSGADLIKVLPQRNPKRMKKYGESCFLIHFQGPFQ